MKKVKIKKYQHIPELISATDLQRKAGRIIDMVKENGRAQYVVRNNKPEIVILSTDEYERMKKIEEQWEWFDTMEAIRIAEKERKNGTLKELKGSLVDLWKALQTKKDDKD